MTDLDILSSKIHLKNSGFGLSLVIPARPLAGRASPRLLVYSSGFCYFTLGPSGPWVRALSSALIWSLCLWAIADGITPFLSPNKPLNCPGTTTTPHLGSTLSCDVTHHRGKPLEAVLLRSPGIGVTTIITSSCIFSLFFTHHAFQSTLRANRGITHSRTTSRHASCADTRLLWLTHMGAPHHKQQQTSLTIIFALLYIYYRCSELVEPASRPPWRIVAS